MTKLLVALLLVTSVHAADWPPEGDRVRVPVSRDTWVSSVRGETRANLGGAPRLKTKGYQEFSLVDIDQVHRRAEPARFLIGDPDAVRGIPVAIDALALLYELAFDRLGLHRVYGLVVVDNKQMMKWHSFLGMKEEGRLREHHFLGGHFRDAICYGMMESEYRTVAVPRMNALIGSAGSPAVTEQRETNDR